uniref:Uncharacterized protein n=1 Tax=Ustilago esculenta TaxID=185366 RepID=A0A481SI96_9BASI|nr:hypothetical protein UEMT_2052 [Ustilago esculenta]
MVKDVREQKNLHLKATGANFNEDEVYATLYNLVGLYNASALKLVFLKLQDTPVSPPPSSQMDHIHHQKHKQAVSAACEAGQTGQTLALQRLCDHQLSGTSLDNTSESPDPQVDLGEDNDETHSSFHSQISPVQKRRRTPKQYNESIAKGRSLIYR